MSWSSNLDLLKKSGEVVKIASEKGAVVIKDQSGSLVVKKGFASFAEAKRFCMMFGLKFEKPQRISFKPGNRFMVVFGSGLDSDRIGTVIQFPGEAELKKAEPGRYKPFDPAIEVVLQDDKGGIFSMFKSRLIPNFDKRFKAQEKISGTKST
jgi:hypothetical protein